MSPKTLYGVAAVLLAGLIISSTFGIFYYNQFAQQSQVANHYASDLSDSASQYNSLASQYDSALSQYNQSLALLAGTVGAVNTSLPIYAQASSQLSVLWSGYLKLKPQSVHVYSADVLFNFGNGTRRWYNNTQIQPGWNLYTATVVITRGNMQATWYPSFGEHFMNSIGGVSGTSTNYWIIWSYNSTASWQKASLGADDLPVYNGSVFAWTFCGQTCKP
jgi:Flp pilus assembly protein TadG